MATQKRQKPFPLQDLRTTAPYSVSDNSDTESDFVTAIQSSLHRAMSEYVPDAIQYSPMSDWFHRPSSPVEHTSTWAESDNADKPPPASSAQPNMSVTPRRNGSSLSVFHDACEGQEDCKTPSLSTSSRSTSTDSLLQSHLSAMYSDMTINSSTASVDTIVQGESSAPSQTVNTQHSTTTAEDHLDDSEQDSRMLAFPLKMAAYALALLPIPMRFFANTSGSADPPLPIERPVDPKTYLPRHRTCSTSSIISPSSSSNLNTMGQSLPNPARPPRKVCFDRVVVITSPHESDMEYDDEEDGDTNRTTT